MSARTVLAKRAAQSTTVKQPQTGASYGTQATANRARPPGSSMAGQVAFSQAQQYQQPPPLSLQQQQQMGAPPRSKVGIRSPSQMPGPQLTQQQQYNSHFGQQGGTAAPPKQKISIESAIALTTIRLSAAEQNIIDIQAQIGDILMNGMMNGSGGGFEEYDEEGNPVMMAAAAAPSGAAGAASGPSIAQMDALKKEVDDLKARFALIEKTTKELPLATNNAMTMIKKLSADNLQFKNQVTQLTNLLNKTMGDMDRKFNEMSQTIATLEYNQMNAIKNNELDDGVQLELERIHEDDAAESTPLFTTENPMHSGGNGGENTTDAAADTPIFAPATSATEPMKPSTGPRRGGAAAAMIAASTNAGNKRAPLANTSSIDL